MQSKRLVLDTVRDAIEKEKVTDGLALHSDQGGNTLHTSILT